MAARQRSSDDDVGAFGRLLRFWRNTVGVSQEELAARTGVSARHVSFLENGRSRPGRNMVGELAAELGLRATDHNNLLTAAGFMPDRVAFDLENESSGWLRSSLRVSLRGFDPGSVSVLDRYGNVHMVNRGWLALYRQLLPEASLAAPINTYRLFFSENGIRPMLVDWEEVACRLLMTLQQEVLLSGDEEAGRMLEELLSYPSIPENWQRRAAQIRSLHSFRLRLRLAGDRVVSFLNVVYTAGNAPTVSEPRVLVSLLAAEDDSFNAELAAICATDIPPHPLLFY